MTPDKPHTSSFEDRLLNQLVEVVARNAPPVEKGAPKVWRSHRRLAAMSIPIVLVVGAVVAVSLLSAQSPGIAQATIIKRTAAALAAPAGILYVEATDHSGNVVLGDEVPVRSIGRVSPDGFGSVDDKQISYTYREWLGEGNLEHIIYDTGDETARQGQTQLTYDPANNVFTSTELPSSAGQGEGIPAVTNLTIAAIESLYQQAEAAHEGIVSLGQKTIGSNATYALQITTRTSSLVLYVDTYTFLPVRAIVESQTPNGHKVVDSTDYTAKVLPDTSANRQLLQIAKHSDAKSVQMTQAQLAQARSANKPEFAQPQNSTTDRSSAE